MNVHFWLNQLRKKFLGTSRAHKAKARRRQARVQLESLEDRFAPAVGDTLSTAFLTGLGPTVGNFSMKSAIGDAGETFANGRDVDTYRFDATAGQTLNAVASHPSGGDPLNKAVVLFNSLGNVLS